MFARFVLAHFRPTEYQIVIALEPGSEAGDVLSGSSRTLGPEGSGERNLQRSSCLADELPNFDAIDRPIVGALPQTEGPLPTIDAWRLAAGSRHVARRAVAGRLRQCAVDPDLAAIERQTLLLELRERPAESVGVTLGYTRRAAAASRLS